MLEKPGWAGIIGRVSRFACLPVPMTGFFESLVGYSLVYNHNGVWHLRIGDQVLAKGLSGLRAREWHTLKLQFAGQHVTAFLDGQQVAEVTDNSSTHGSVGLMCNWPGVQFDNLEIAPLPAEAK